MENKVWKEYTSRQCLHKAYSKQQQGTESWVKGFSGQIAGQCWILKIDKFLFMSESLQCFQYVLQICRWKFDRKPFFSQNTSKSLKRPICEILKC